MTELNISDIGTIKKRFQEVNKKRLDRVQELLRSKQRVFLEVLPFLFHINNPRLPGYIDDNTPFGVSGYKPSPETINTAKQINRLFSNKFLKMNRNPDIHTLFLMGSSGSIAQSPDSDLDIWLCHNPELPIPKIQSLQRKAIAIEEWAETLKLEVHFFMMNADKFRAGETIDLSSESSGSAQHLMLLDEFYRTSLYVAGKYPLWWIIPPEQESQYESYIQQLKDQFHFNVDETIDLGCLSTMPVNEFFGATVWQLNKALGSPYKAILKILLMEAYAKDYPDSVWLSVEFKQMIYDNILEPEKLDPYILMLRKIEQLLSDKSEQQRLLLARQCFYTKTNKRLSIKDPNAGPWQLDLLENLTAEWNWDSNTLVSMDNRKSWKIDRVHEEHKLLSAALTKSYSTLSEFSRKHAQESRINPQDLNLLGRKLYVSLSHEKGKIEIINTGINCDLSEEHLSFHQNTKINRWTLYQGKPTNTNTKGNALKQSNSLLELITWAHLNKILDTGTRINLNTSNTVMTIRELLAIIKAVQQYIPGGKLAKTSLEQIAETEAITSSILFINIGIDPMMELSKGGSYRAAHNMDPLNYSSFQKNLVVNLDNVIKTSWQQVFAYNYNGSDSIADCICNYINLIPLSKAKPPCIQAYNFSSRNSAVLIKRIEKLFSEVINWLITNPCSQYILHAGNTYYLFQYIDDKLSYKKFQNSEALLHELGSAKTAYTTTSVESKSITKSPLRAIFATNRENCIQFYSTSEHANELFILDEKGALFHQKTIPQHPIDLLSHYYHFVETILSQKHAENTEFQPTYQLQYYKLNQDQK